MSFDPPRFPFYVHSDQWIGIMGFLCSRSGDNIFLTILAVAMFTLWYYNLDMLVFCLKILDLTHVQHPLWNK